MMVVAVASAATSVGCVSKPTLQLHSASIAGANPRGVSMSLVVRVNNKNSFDVRVRNVRANVVIGERYRLPQITYNPDQWLGSNRTTLLRVPVTIPWNMVTPLVRSGASSSEIDYHVNALIDVTAVRMLGISVTDYKIDDDGSISRGQLVSAAALGLGR